MGSDGRLGVYDADGGTEDVPEFLLAAAGCTRDLPTDVYSTCHQLPGRVLDLTQVDSC